jgi:hypothetical protein
MGRNGMRELYAVLAATIIGLAAVPVALAEEPDPRTFVVVLTAEEEVPRCAAAANDSRGVAIFKVLDEATGLVSYKVVANNIPGTITAAHIHPGTKGSANPFVQATPLTPGAENGVVGEGTFTNPALVEAIRTNPQAFYFNVHSTACPSGVIRGQFGDHGP